MSEQTVVINGSGGGVAYIAMVILGVLVLLAALVYISGGRPSFAGGIDVNGLAQQQAQQSAP